MSGFRIIEYSGKDAGKVLQGIMHTSEDDEKNVVDIQSRTVLGFTMNPEEEEQEDDDEDTD